jgi:hypothetical protein
MNEIMNEWIMVGRWSGLPSRELRTEHHQSRSTRPVFYSPSLGRVILSSMILPTVMSYVILSSDDPLLRDLDFGDLVLDNPPKWSVLHDRIRYAPFLHGPFSCYPSHRDPILSDPVLRHSGLRDSVLRYYIPRHIV